MPTKRTAAIWGSYEPVSRWDCIINSICGQVGGYWPGISPESRNWWKNSRRENPRQVQYLAWSSQQAPTAYESDHAEYWRNWANNPIPADHPRIAEWTIPGTKLMNIGAAGYAEAWAEWAVKKARAWERIGHNHFSGVFADSICWNWWWGGTLPECYGSIQNYRKAQERFCEIVGEYVSNRRYKFGANVGVVEPGYSIWPEIFEHLDLAFKEHVRASDRVDPVVADRNRQYALAVHIEPDSRMDVLRLKLLEQLHQRYAARLGPRDYVTYSGKDCLQG